MSDDYDSNKPEEAGSEAVDFEVKQEDESKYRADLDTHGEKVEAPCPFCGNYTVYKWDEPDGPDDYITEYYCTLCKERITP